MKKFLLLTVSSLMFVFFISAQQITISFQPKADTVSIDSVHVTNLTRGQSAKLLPGESVVFNIVTSAERLLLNGSEDGYLYPNPTDGYTTLIFSTDKSEKVFVAIYDMQGKMLISKTQNLMQGSHRFHLRFPAPGLYHIAVLKNEKPLSFKAVYTGRNQQEADIHYPGIKNFANDESQKDQLKSAQNGKSLDYSEGDVVHYTVFSGDNTTVISDKPTGSKTIEVELYDCKDKDGRSYKTVKIGDQTWMAENLAYLPSVSPTSIDSDSEPCYYVYDYHGTNVAEAKATEKYNTYGAMYNWPAAMTACPPGWHLASDAEWTQLEHYLIQKGYNYDGTNYDNKIGKALAAKSLWATSSDKGAVGNDLSLNNSSGFSALPGGDCQIGTSLTFWDAGTIGRWWTSTEGESRPNDEGIYETNDAFMREIHYRGVDLQEGNDVSKYIGFNARCIKD